MMRIILAWDALNSCSASSALRFKLRPVPKDTQNEGGPVALPPGGGIDSQSLGSACTAACCPRCTATCSQSVGCGTSMSKR